MIRDAALYVVMLFIFSLSLLVIFAGYDMISDSFQNNSVIPQSQQDRISDMKEEFPQYMDYTFLTIFIAMFIGVIILSYALQTNPALFFIFVIIVALIGGLAGYLSNSYDDVIADTTLKRSSDQFPIMSFVMENYMIFVVVMIMLMMIVFFSKPGGAA